MELLPVCQHPGGMHVVQCDVAQCEPKQAQADLPLRNASKMDAGYSKLVLRVLALCADGLAEKAALSQLRALGCDDEKQLAATLEQAFHRREEVPLQQVWHPTTTAAMWLCQQHVACHQQVHGSVPGSTTTTPEVAVAEGEVEPTPRESSEGVADVA